jgi:hypothetical protein
MKMFATIAMTLALIGLAHANPFDDTRRLDTLNNACRAPGSIYAGGEGTSESNKACDDVDKLTKSLEARGFCVYGHGVIGIKGKGYHCYRIKGIGE